jgi:hypothetical protein
MRPPDGKGTVPSSPAKQTGHLPLTREQVLQLDAALVEAFQLISSLRSRNEAARHIKFPPLPSIFSESIVIAAAGRIFGAQWIATFGGHECDIRLEDERGQRKLVEVKATGANAFQELKAKDLRADVLVWVRFGDRFQRGDGPIEIVALNNPHLVIPSPCRLDTIRFERLVGHSSALSVFRFASLSELLGD